MNIIGYCKECSTIIHHEDRIDTTNVYECSKCKHPQTKEEVELRPFEIKSGERRMKLDKIELAMELMLKEFWKEHGGDAFLEEGDAITGVFNDGIVKIMMGPGKDLSVEVLLGEPYKFDITLGL